ncbi:bifunctional heptose 7-phosphate kinase/heptose 1-phosphate adenyltransferase [Streptomyces sp. NPDC002514]|uniref:bifunctional heptose 7-phosphate kinase/heptose 1-phosphate adenyltransferase n=1 Tax=Streptomyces sp. NPDC001270 TaxID=3364554 RepID=UPI00367482BA
MPDLRSALRAVAGKRLVVVGDLILDAFTHGTVERISPEAPVPVLRQERTRQRASGAAAAAQAAAALGAQVEVFGTVGEDEEGRLISELLGRAGIRTGLIRTPDRPTTLKTRMVGNGQHLLRVDRESTTVLPPPYARRLRELLRAALDTADAVLVSDYAKGVCAPDLIRSVIDVSRARSVPVVVDPKRPDPRVYAGATAVTPNQREFAAFCASLGYSADTPHRSGRRLCATAGFSALLITRAADGMTVVAGEHVEDLPALNQEPVDVAGAGDVAAAVLALSLTAGLTPSDGARLASIACALVVGRWEYAVTPADMCEGARRFGVPL